MPKEDNNLAAPTAVGDAQNQHHWPSSLHYKIIREPLITPLRFTPRRSRWHGTVEPAGAILRIKFTM